MIDRLRESILLMLGVVVVTSKSGGANRDRGMDRAGAAARQFYGFPYFFFFFPSGRDRPNACPGPLAGHDQTHGAEWLSPEWSLGLALGVPTRPC